ncbi:MAG: transcriptional regulator [Candidatus Methanomethylicia archaeon]|nr:transcriptional regulator [Candidatus Methanomethylicia archaeon]MCQ5374483.1 transcriptional regulator [Candidatus Methanomethylicia archaeon]
MSRDQALGSLLLIFGVLGIIIYGWLVFFTGWWTIVIQITAFLAVAAILAILAWIGYTLATTPPPKPIEEIEKELEASKSEEDKAGPDTKTN